MFPWGDDPNTGGLLANWENSGDPYETGDYPWTTPVGFYNGQLHLKTDFNWPGSQTSYQTSNAVNGYGLYDMAGNVWQWTNDWYANGYYSVSPSSNPTGPTTGDLMPDGKPYRGMRGGNWYNGAQYYGMSRISNRDPGYYRGPRTPTTPITTSDSAWPCIWTASKSRPSLLTCRCSRLQRHQPRRRARRRRQTTPRTTSPSAGLPVLVQVTPESVDSGNIHPPASTATSCVPSADDATHCHSPEEPRRVRVTPAVSRRRLPRCHRSPPTPTFPPPPGCPRTGHRCHPCRSLCHQRHIQLQPPEP